jgi:hypothetical protein
MFVVPLAGVDGFTGFASTLLMSPSYVDSRVLGCEFVATTAMCLTGVPQRGAPQLGVPSLGHLIVVVLAWRAEEPVCRVAARRVITGVADDLTVWYGADQ